eukprot:Hpha_TRINITY_DN9732_c0_g1::TRINITY_DN9732_c0_g1_i1::g.10334::m.10334
MHIHFSGKKLLDSVLLSDAGVCPQSTVEAIAEGFVFNSDLPHGACTFDETNTEVSATFEKDTIVVLLRRPVPPVGVTRFWVSVKEYRSGANYFGVGFSPFPKVPQQLESRRIANDSSSSRFQGNGWSYNQNGCTYGPPITMSGSTRSLDKEDLVEVQITMPSQDVSITLSKMGQEGGDKKTITGKSTFTEEIFPAIFLQYGSGTVLKLWDRHPSECGDE